MREKYCRIFDYARGSVIALALILFVQNARAQDVYETSDPGVSWEILGRARNGMNGWELGVIDLVPTFVNPEWTDLSNSPPYWPYGELLDFEFIYTVSSGNIWLGVDYNRDGAITDGTNNTSNEIVTYSFSGFQGKGFRYIGVSAAGNSLCDVNLENWTINGTPFSSRSSQGGQPEWFFDLGLNSVDVAIVGQIQFTADGGQQESPAIDFKLGMPKPCVPKVEGPACGTTSCCNDGIDNDCDGLIDFDDSDCLSCIDADNDGYFVGGNGCGIADCDDSDPRRNPGLLEVCDDRVDNDCDRRKDNSDPEGCVYCDATSTTDETCNGIDDNCNGLIDEDYTSIPISCGLGVCASIGQKTCIGGVETDDCTPGPQEEPNDAICDGRDGDCDGLVDEDYISLPTSCGLGACASTGQILCLNATLEDSCVPGIPAESPEISCNDSLDNDCDGLIDISDTDCACTPTGIPDDNCDTIDDDCDGSTDEDYVPTPTGCGIGECASTGYLLCQSGSEIDTCVEGTPLLELCDSLDNDCDGSTDEDYPTLGTPCTVGVGACQATGTEVCSFDALYTICSATAYSPAADDSICNGIDDDCDGSTDEDYIVIDTCGSGVCQTNNTASSCTLGIEIVCVPGLPTESSETTCDDGIDNDCDGQTDGNDSDCDVSCTPPPVRQEVGIRDVQYSNLVEADCRFCHENPDSSSGSDVTIPNRHHLLVGTIITEPTDVPYGTPGNTYECLSCHDVDTSTGYPEFLVERDCLACHIQSVSELTVHHRTELAQGTLPQGPDCQSCHGDIVDNRDDGHLIPSYDPTQQTPKRSGGTGLPLNSRGAGAGACDYCHNDGSCVDTMFIETSTTTHHNTGLGTDSAKCSWCHDFNQPFESQIRICENCHGQDSLHNIQTDSDGDNVIQPGIEQPFYGHIGNPDDCWGCHGYAASALTAPESGTVVPIIGNSSNTVLDEGSDVPITLSGVAFTNIDTDIEVYSEITLIDRQGSSITLIPDLIAQDSMTVTIPGTLAKGTYKVKAVKRNKQSNPLAVSIKPAVTIDRVNCRSQNKQIIISGAGFGQRPDGSDNYINVEYNGILIDEIIVWTDSEIRGRVTECINPSTVTINSVFGSATK